MTNTIIFATASQKALWDHELAGQISDGYWENTRGTDYETWCGALTVVGINTGRDFYPRKDNFNFLAKDLLDIVGDRMELYGRLAKAGLYEYIRDLEEVINIRDDGKVEWKGNGPDYKGEYYIAMRARLATMNRVEILTKIAAVTYGRKELRADLRAIKAIIRSYNDE